MPLRVLTRLLEAFKERSLAIEDSKVLVLGLAYKKDIDDTRESPALEIIELLLQHRAAVGFHDPYISKLPVTLARWDDLPEPQSVELTTEVLSSYDATIIVTDHGKVDYAVVQAYAPLVIDTRGVYRKSYANVVRA
jgi:UDP-N-acetyl-D-glucosamine dehydrogenase